MSLFDSVLRNRKPPFFNSVLRNRKPPFFDSVLRNRKTPRMLQGATRVLLLNRGCCCTDAARRHAGVAAATRHQRGGLPRPYATDAGVAAATLMWMPWTWRLAMKHATDAGGVLTWQ